MKLSSIIIGIAIFSGLLSGFTIFFYNLGSAYNVSGINNLSTLDKARNVSSFANETQRQLESIQKGNGLTTIFTEIGLLWGVLQQMVALPFTLIGLTTDVAISLPFVLAGWFIIMVSIIITLVVLLKVISWFTGRET